MRRVGFVGLGVMGKGLAGNLREAGFPLLVLDVDPARVRELVALGAGAASSPAQMAEQVDVLGMALPGSAQVGSVVFGANGVLSGIRAGAIVVDFSTVSPGTARRVAAALETKGARFIDAGMTTSQKPPRRPQPDVPSRIVAQAMAGTLRLYLGGDPATIEEVRDVLDAVSQEQVYCGPNGSGMAVKLVNNMVTIATNGLLSELFVWAAKNGASARTVFDALSQSSANSSALQGEFSKKALRGDFVPGLFPVNYMYKDAGETLAAASEAHVPMPYIGLTRQLLEMSRAAGEGELYYPAFLKVFERLAGGVEPRLGSD